MNTPIVKNILIGAILVAIIVFAYVFLVNKEDKKEPKPPLSRESVATSTTSMSAAGDGDDTVSLLRRAGSITLDTDFFESSAFAELKDYRVFVPKELVGRSNPFAPVR